MKQFLIFFMIIMIMVVIYSMLTLNDYDETIRRVDRKIEMANAEAKR